MSIYHYYQPIYIRAGRLLLIILPAIMFLIACQPPNAAPQFIKKSVEFEYPIEAYDQRIEGTVTLYVQINTNGRIQYARIYRSSGYAILDSAALDLAEEARFKPGRVNGRAATMWLTWPLVFNFEAIAENTEKWREKVREKQDIAARGLATAQYELLVYYRGMARKMVNERLTLLNEVTLSVCLPEVEHQWEDYMWDSPLSFVLFQDFIERYPESEHRKTAEDYFIDYLTFEITYLRNSPIVEGSRTSQKKQELLEKLVQFVHVNYPNVSV